MNPRIECQIRPSAEPRMRKTSRHQPTREGRMRCPFKAEGQRECRGERERDAKEELALLSFASASASKFKLGKASAAS